MWVAQVAAPQAQQQFGVGLARIDHLGSYACRNVYHRPVGRRSEHATAEALDIAGFRLANGRRLRVLNDWASSDASGRYLRTLFQEGCGFFGSAWGRNITPRTPIIFIWACAAMASVAEFFLAEK